MFFNKPQLNKIGFYQFDNLVQNRVPFLFVNMGPDVASLYESIYKLHINTYQKRLASEEVESFLSLEKIPKDFAILLLCENGKTSEKLAQKLNKSGYSNVYLMDGGYQQMMTDRENSDNFLE